MRRVISLSFLLLFAASVGVGNVRAGDMATMSFLRLGVGGQEIAMGGAGVSTTKGANALYWNPAGLAGSPNLEVRLTHTEWFQGFRHEYAAVSRKWAGMGFGFGVLAMYADKLEKYDEFGVYEGEFGYYDLALMLGAGRKVGEQFEAGLTTKLLRSSIDVYSATSFAVDLGAKYYPGYKGLTIGASVNNVGMDVTYIMRADPLPRYAQIGASYQFEGPIRGTTMLSALDLRKSMDDDLQVHLGLQCLLEAGFSFRLGYKGGYENENISTGIGYSRERISIDYAYVPFYSDLGGTHRITFGYVE